MYRSIQEIERFVVDRLNTVLPVVSHNYERKLTYLRIQCDYCDEFQVYFSYEKVYMNNQLVGGKNFMYVPAKTKRYHDRKNSHNEARLIMELD